MKRSTNRPPLELTGRALYEAFGYTRKSERKTGLTRRKRGEPAEK